MISALLGLPVFFTAAAPGWARISVAVLITGAAIAFTRLAPAARPTPAKQT
ncbi:hypothetical protein ACIQI8_43900 [Streptomyces sp. NPDC092369]|uniref:hypothetical protein n=1 Tax=Streptomyces sp. NPDC092369 TaxID=3366015 RepID=UPI0037F19FAD